ncbi:dTDP-4-dehydrorhamnose 3,5-epimerase [Paraclostridium bifermentans]|uniref:dTDP-4-dehydrorhamnose 3,5-epimerase n=1 Tax=Paraclostridium bifermentans TaxID=1490 RepID=UPI00290C3574|nr:dTDP-4-dehydrorhamnose 3,5-epimerase [Paraclostridium bifermentans]MDU3336061.1 dTDP-4-dehydrorhamnose 3,5-epimerase [Paraclostridium bifermentans]
MYKIIKTELVGCMQIIPNIFNDKRGKSLKTYHKTTFKKLGIVEDFKEDLIVTSNKGVLRGLHFQKKPYEQSKLVYCLKGSVLDVVLDIRKNSNTYGKYICINLSGDKGNMIYIPAGFAHGYLSLEDNSIVGYKMSQEYNPEYEDGIKWNSLDIPWNIENPIISDRDKVFKSFIDYKE